MQDRRPRPVATREVELLRGRRSIRTRRGDYAPGPGRCPGCLQQAQGVSELAGTCELAVLAHVLAAAHGLRDGATTPRSPRRLSTGSPLRHARRSRVAHHEHPRETYVRRRDSPPRPAGRGVGDSGNMLRAATRVDGWQLSSGGRARTSARRRCPLQRGSRRPAIARCGPQLPVARRASGTPDRSSPTSASIVTSCTRVPA